MGNTKIHHAKIDVPEQKSVRCEVNTSQRMVIGIFEHLYKSTITNKLHALMRVYSNLL